MRITTIRTLVAIKRRALALFFNFVNVTSSRSLIGQAEVAVNLTTYGQRTRTVHLAIESIARGNISPALMILWLSQPEFSQGITKPLARLQKRGLEIRECFDFGPHKKYYPYLQLGTDDYALVTADDDVFYPRSWLRDLLKTSGEHSMSVVCHRAHRIAMDSTSKQIAPYSQWGPCVTSSPSILNFPTGVSGVLYPASILRILRDAGDSFTLSAPRADDVWLHAQTVRAGFTVTQTSDLPADYLAIPRTGTGSLFGENVAGGGNDRQIKNTYSEQTVRSLLTDWQMENA